MQLITSTERLNLRELSDSDAPWLLELHQDPEVMKYSGDRIPENLTEIFEFLKEFKKNDTYSFGRWGIVLKETNQIIGWCGFDVNEFDQVNLAFRIMKKYWNNGYATEAARACISHLFKSSEIEEIVGRAAIENIASIKVLEKIKMAYWKEDACKSIANSVYYKIKNPKFIPNI